MKAIRAKAPKAKVEYNDGADLAAAAAAMSGIGDVSAAIEVWYPGIRGDVALANILFGDVNPSGKLPVSFAKSDADLPHPQIPGLTPPPAEPGRGRGRMAPFDIDYTEGLKVGYKWFDAEKKEPLFAFGHGLSYTTYAYSGLKAGIDTVTFTVRNTGKRAGAEIAQVYAGLPAAAQEPPKRLVAWERIPLEPGESKTVTLAIDPKFLSIFNEQKDGWELLPGEYQFFVGGSSRVTPLTAAVKH
jgi:beta-glucosidase